MRSEATRTSPLRQGQPWEERMKGVSVLAMEQAITTSSIYLYIEVKPILQPKIWRSSIGVISLHDLKHPVPIIHCSICLPSGVGYPFRTSWSFSRRTVRWRGTSDATWLAHNKHAGTKCRYNVTSLIWVRELVYCTWGLIGASTNGVVNWKSWSGRLHVLFFTFSVMDSLVSCLLPRYIVFQIIMNDMIVSGWLWNNRVGGRAG